MNSCWLKNTRHVSNAIRMLLLAMLMPTCLLSANDHFQSPSSYDDFVALDKYDSLNDAIKKEKYIIIPAGTYEIDNPIIIHRDRPLYLLGVARQRVKLVAKDLTKPLFIVEKAPFFQCAYLSIGPTTVSAVTKVINIDMRHEHHGFVFKNTTPIHMAFQGLCLRESAIKVAGPGTFIFRGMRSSGLGVIPYGLMIDHPEAQVFLRGGVGMSRGTPFNDAYMENNHVIWKKRGHLEMSTVGGEQNGKGFVRIDTPSPRGADILNHVRSEGVKLHEAGSQTIIQGKSVLLYVPPTDEAVNVLIQCSKTRSKPTDPPGLHTYANYNGAGTLWLLGNHSKEGIGTLAEGQADNATVIAAGNTFLGNKHPLEMTAHKKLAVHNLIAISKRLALDGISQDPDKPNFKVDNNIEQGLTLNDFPEALKPPAPAPLPKVKILHWKNTPPSNLLVSVKQFGAKGDGKTDDTQALQRAIDANGWQLYFPAGEYVITRPLGLNNTALSDVQHKKAGGWWAGAGSDKTIIKNIAGGSVFVTQGIAFYKFEGMTFQTKPYGDDPCFVVNNVISKGGRNCKAQHFFDCRFVGGSIAFGLGLEVGPQVDFHYHDDCRFEKAKQGYAIGCFNNLQEIVINSHFVDNVIDCGHTSLGQNGGGTAAFYNCVTTGNRGKFLDLHLQGTALWYFNSITGTVPKIIDQKKDGNPFMVFFDRCDFQGSDPKSSLIQSACAGSIFYNHARLTNGTIKLHDTKGPKALFALFSEIEGLDRAVIEGTSAVIELE